MLWPHGKLQFCAPSGAKNTSSATGQHATLAFMYWAERKQSWRSGWIGAAEVQQVLTPSAGCSVERSKWLPARYPASHPALEAQRKGSHCHFFGSSGPKRASFPPAWVAFADCVSSLYPELRSPFLCLGSLRSRPHQDSPAAQEPTMIGKHVNLEPGPVASWRLFKMKACVINSLIR